MLGTSLGQSWNRNEYIPKRLSKFLQSFNAAYNSPIKVITFYSLMTPLISSDHIWFFIIVAINRITGWKPGQNPVLCYSLGFRALQCNLAEKFMRVLYLYFKFFADHGMPILCLGRILIIRKKRPSRTMKGFRIWSTMIPWVSLQKKYNTKNGNLLSSI